MNNVDWTLVMALGTWAMALVMALANWRIIRQNRSLVSAAGQQMKEGVRQTQLMRSQFEAMTRGMERPKIIELAKNVLNPFIYELDKVIKTHYPGRLTVWGDEEGLLNDFERRLSGIKQKIDQFNKDSGVLDSRIEHLKGMINTPEFKEKCRELIKKYNDTVPLDKQLREEDLDSHAETFAYFVIINRKEFDISEQSRAVDFWRVHGSELLKVREESGIQNAVREVDSLRDEYMRRARELREKLVQLKEEWVANFNLLREKIGEEAL